MRPEAHRRPTPGTSLERLRGTERSNIGDDQPQKLTVRESGTAPDWTLSDGTTLRELVQSEPIVVVVVDPSQCLLCSSVLAEWLHRERMSGVNVELLLAREPENHERRILLAAGVRADGYLRGVQIEPQRTPIELVVDSGGVLFRAERVYGPSSPLLDALEDGRSLREAVDALSVLEHEAKSTTEEMK